MGNVPNNGRGRISLWTDIVKHQTQLQEIGAIEDFSDENVTVSAGESKSSVVIDDVITVINAMSQLYMTVKIA